MMIGRVKFGAWLCGALCVGMGMAVHAFAQDAPPPVASSAAEPPSATAPIDPEQASEQVLIAEIQRLAMPTRSNLSSDVELTLFHDDRLKAIAFIDQLLERYPHSMFRDEALVTKLRVRADLALLQPSYLGAFLQLIQELAKTEPRGSVAEALAYYEIRAFVLGARYEDMPRERQLVGTTERYKSFLERFPLSAHAPVIWASFVRNLLELGWNDKAEKALEEMVRRYPDHSATRRASGEVRRAAGVGKPFAMQWLMSDGKTVKSSDFLGKVLVVHFWVSVSEQSVVDIDRLKSLYEKHRAAGLELFGVNADPDHRRGVAVIVERDVTWPQQHDGKGLRSEAIVDGGVLSFPTYFYIDRKGVLRGVDSGEGLDTLVPALIVEP
jgi:hypothetical protein